MLERSPFLDKLDPSPNALLIPDEHAGRVLGELPGPVDTHWRLGVSALHGSGH